VLVMESFQDQDFSEALRLLDGALEEGITSALERADAHWYRAGARAYLDDTEGEHRDLRAYQQLVTARDQRLPAGAEGADILRRLKLAELTLLAAQAASDERVARSPRNAVAVHMVGDEYMFLQAVRCGPDLSGHYELQSQALLQEGPHSFDVLEAACSEGGGSRTFHFDIDFWMAFFSMRASGGELPDIVREQGFDEEGAQYLMERLLSF